MELGQAAGDRISSLRERLQRLKKLIDSESSHGVVTETVGSIEAKLRTFSTDLDAKAESVEQVVCKLEELATMQWLIIEKLKYESDGRTLAHRLRVARTAHSATDLSETTESVVTLVLDMDFDSVRPNTKDRKRFCSSLLAEVSAAINILPEMLRICRVLPGSVVVEIEVVALFVDSRSTLSLKAREIYEQGNDPTSFLRTQTFLGKYVMRAILGKCSNSNRHSPFRLSTPTKGFLSRESSASSVLSVDDEFSSAQPIPQMQGMAANFDTSDDLSFESKTVASELKPATSGTSSIVEAGIAITLALSSVAPYPEVHSIIPNGPAFSSGRLLERDIIVAVNGASTLNVSCVDTGAMIRGPVGTAVSLSILRGGVTEPIHVQIVRDVLEGSVPSTSAAIAVAGADKVEVTTDATGEVPPSIANHALPNADHVLPRVNSSSKTNHEPAFFNGDASPALPTIEARLDAIGHECCEGDAGQPSKATVRVGIGIRLSPPTDSKSGPVISMVKPGGCADAAGLKVDDRLMSVNGVDVTRLPLTATSELIVGEVNSVVAIAVQRGILKKDFSIVRHAISESLSPMASPVTSPQHALPLPSPAVVSQQLVASDVSQDQGPADQAESDMGPGEKHQVAIPYPQSPYIAPQALGPLSKAQQSPTQGPHFSPGGAGADGVGVGIVIGLQEEKMRVLAMNPIGSAQLSGKMIVGDEIIRVSSRDCAQMSAKDISDVVRGPPGTFVEFTVRRQPSNSLETFSIERLRPGSSSSVTGNGPAIAGESGSAALGDLGAVSLGVTDDLKLNAQGGMIQVQEGNGEFVKRYVVLNRNTLSVFEASAVDVAGKSVAPNAVPLIQIPLGQATEILPVSGDGNKKFQVRHRGGYVIFRTARAETRDSWLQLLSSDRKL